MPSNVCTVQPATRCGRFVLQAISKIVKPSTCSLMRPTIRALPLDRLRDDRSPFLATPACFNHADCPSEAAFEFFLAVLDHLARGHRDAATVAGRRRSVCFIAQPSRTLHGYHQTPSTLFEITTADRWLPRHSHGSNQPAGRDGSRANSGVALGASLRA